MCTFMIFKIMFFYSAARQIIRYAPHLVDVKAEGHAPLHIAAINNHVVIATNLLEEVSIYPSLQNKPSCTSFTPFQLKCC